VSIHAAARIERHPHSLWSLHRHIRFHGGRVWGVVLLLIARSAVLLVTPWPLKLIVDTVIYQKPLAHWLVAYLPDPSHHRMALLNVLGLGLLVLGAAENFLSYHGDRLLLIVGQEAVFQLRGKLFSHLQRLSLAFHRRQRIGDLMSRLGGDINALQDFVINAGSGVFAHLLTVVGMAAILLSLDWRYALVVVSAAPALLWVTDRYAKRVKHSLRRARRKESEVWGTVQEILGAIHVVQAYGREATEEARFTRRVEESLGIALEATSLQLQLPRLVGFVFAVGTAVTLWFGAIEVMNDHITAGDLLVFRAYLRGMATPIRQIAKMVGSFGKAEVSAERIGDLLSEVTDIKEAPDAIRIEACAGKIEFRSVSFGYSADVEILTDVSFRMDAGETIALVGPTGAGKSTIAGLIPRFYDPTRGEILLDGVDLRRLSIESLRANIAVITQEPLLFTGAVWENIAIGRPHANRDDAIAAARASGIDDLIRDLPEGYDTLIGERGATLSGGQRQFISFARAMLKDAPIVILDEPTSSLDSVTERLLGAALKRLTKGRTTLVIAHRLSTVVSVDRILVLDHGRIVQSGTHEQLLRMDGPFAELWRQGGHVQTSEMAIDSGFVR